jgi:hypothetical protein
MSITSRKNRSTVLSCSTAPVYAFRSATCGQSDDSVRAVRMSWRVRGKKHFDSLPEARKVHHFPGEKIPSRAARTRLQKGHLRTLVRSGQRIPRERETSSHVQSDTLTSGWTVRCLIWTDDFSSCRFPGDRKIGRGIRARGAVEKGQEKVDTCRTESHLARVHRANRGCFSLHSEPTYRPTKESPHTLPVSHTSVSVGIARCSTLRISAVRIPSSMTRSAFRISGNGRRTPDSWMLILCARFRSTKCTVSARFRGARGTLEGASLKEKSDSSC